MLASHILIRSSFLFNFVTSYISPSFEKLPKTWSFKAMSIKISKNISGLGLLVAQNKSPPV